MWVMMTSHSNFKQNNPKTFCLRVLWFYVFIAFLNNNEIIQKHHERRTRRNGSGCCRTEGKRHR